MDSHFLRYESGRLVVQLTKRFGTHHLPLIEDVVQDTLLKAWEIWRFRGIPENPSAWLFRVAWNLAIDALRRQQRQMPFTTQVSETLLTAEPPENPPETIFLDEVLRLMFVCCHPDLPREAQVSLILKYLCGFSVQEIARAFLTNEANIEKRLYRARKAFRTKDIPLEVPSPHILQERLDQVLLAIYLLFNEGYKSNQPDEVIRRDLIAEALRLGNLLAENPITQTPAVFALLALMCFQAARTEARLTETGALCLLPAQDRTLWDNALITIGKHFLNRSATGEGMSRYHLEAGIAWEHTKATSFETTNWHKILRYYNVLEEYYPSPMTSLNRLIALSEVEGPEAARLALDASEVNKTLAKNHLFHTVRAHFLYRTDEPEHALRHWRKALHLAPSHAEQAFIEEKIAHLTTLLPEAPTPTKPNKHP